MRALRLLIVMSLGLAAHSAIAQPAPRTIAADSGSGWTHKLTKLSLPPTAAGLTRNEILDLTAEELDLAATYADPAGDLVTTIYVYQPGVQDVAIWFDRATWAIQASPQYGLGGIALPAPTAFAPPRTGAAGGLRLALDLPGTELKSTAVAIAPIGAWLVKVRMSSRKLDKAALDSRLDSLLAALGWPAESGTARAAVAILPCPTPLKTKQAKIVRDDMAAVLINAVSFSMQREGPPPLYCREPGLPPEFGVYRANGDKDSYVVTLNDAGAALSVGPSLGGLLGGNSRKTYSLSRLDHGSAAVLPSFNRLPPPAQAVSVAQGSAPMISATPPR